VTDRDNIDELIGLLRSTSAGCYIADVFIGCIMYADDLILLSPCVAGLQSMLDVCTVYGTEFDIVLNAKKCVLSYGCWQASYAYSSE